MFKLLKLSLKQTVLFIFGACSLHAQDNFPEFNFTGYGDLRASYSSGEPSWLDRGLGKTRYGSDPFGNNEVRFNLAEAALLMETKFNWQLSSYLNLKFDPEQKNSIDVVEAYFKYNKLLDAGYRLEGRLGSFYPHISLENFGIGWTSPYSITPSAINSWIGEEVKTTGLEISTEHEFENHALRLNAGMFGFNDPSGTLLFFRGWALHDNKTTLFGEYPIAPLNIISPTGMFDKQSPFTVPHLELDNRPGFFAGFNWEYFGIFSLNGIYYDNRGDPSIVKNGQYSWETEFINLGLTVDIFEETEIFGQFMTGKTKMGPWVDNVRPADVDYQSFYLMVSHPIGIHRISARYDNFSVSDNSFVAVDNNNETGHSLMIAYAVEPFENQQLIFEFLHVISTRFARIELGLGQKIQKTSCRQVTGSHFNCRPS